MRAGVQVFLNMVVAGIAAELDPNSESSTLPEDYSPGLATIVGPANGTVAAQNGEDSDDMHAAGQEHTGALALLAVGNSAQFSGSLFGHLYSGTLLLSSQSSVYLHSHLFIFTVLALDYKYFCLTSVVEVGHLPDTEFLHVDLDRRLWVPRSTPGRRSHGGPVRNGSVKGQGRILLSKLPGALYI